MQGQRGVLQGIVIHICQQTELCNIWSDNICTCGQFLHGRQEFGSIHIIGHAVITHYRINQKKSIWCLERIQKMKNLFNLRYTGNVTGVDPRKASAEFLPFLTEIIHLIGKIIAVVAWIFCLRT